MKLPCSHGLHVGIYQIPVHIGSLVATRIVSQHGGLGHRIVYVTETRLSSYVMSLKPSCIIDIGVTINPSNLASMPKPYFDITKIFKFEEAFREWG